VLNLPCFSKRWVQNKLFKAVAVMNSSHLFGVTD
jgi:hypothetical protein